MSGREFFLKRYRDLGWSYREPRLRQAIRVNSANTNEAQLIERLENRGVQLERIPFLKHGYWISRSNFSIGATVEYLLGLYSIQEAAAQIPVTLFMNLKNKNVLDACAAPGGKTTQLADLMRDTGIIVALDVDSRRLTALSNQLERCGTNNVLVYRMDARKTHELEMKFSRILLDVPCSGNFATDPQWFQHRTLTDIKANAQLQRQLLSEAARVLDDDGEIVYSTCSLEPEEDELNINWATKEVGLEVEEIDCHGEEAMTNVFGEELDESISRCRRIWPDQTQGFFICKLTRRR